MYLLLICGGIAFLTLVIWVISKIVKTLKKK